MLIYPAIDIMNGTCVRLRQGDFNVSETFSDDPIATAQQWQDQGAQWLHVVDLDGAREGKPRNMGVIKDICGNLPHLSLQVGGGIRSIEAAEALLNSGAKRIIIGTSAVTDQAFLTEMITRFDEQVIVALDARNGFVATNGWTHDSTMPVYDAAMKLAELGISRLIVTDISKDGMLQGPNISLFKEIQSISGLPVIASGGVSSLEDINQLKTAGVEGAIIGKALYTGRIKLSEAIEESNKLPLSAESERNYAH